MFKGADFSKFEVKVANPPKHMPADLGKLGGPGHIGGFGTVIGGRPFGAVGYSTPNIGVGNNSFVGASIAHGGQIGHAGKSVTEACFRVGFKF